MNANSTRATNGPDTGRLALALGGVVLLVSLFIDWFGIGRGFDEEALSAWTIFEIVDLLLALIALAAIATALLPLARNPNVPELPRSLATVLGPVALVLVATSLINKPPLAQDTDIEAGAWLALAGAAIMCAGALLAMNRVSLVIAPRDDHQSETRGGTAAAPERTQGERPLHDETATRQMPPR